MGICWQVMILVANVDISLCMYQICYKRDYLCLDSDPIWWWHPFTLVLLEQPEVYLSLHSLSRHVYKMLAEHFHDCDYGVGMAMNSWSLGWSTFMGSCHGIFQQQFGLNWLMIMTMIWLTIMTRSIYDWSIDHDNYDFPPEPSPGGTRPAPSPTSPPGIRLRIRWNQLKDWNGSTIPFIYLLYCCFKYEHLSFPLDCIFSLAFHYI